MSDLDLIRQTLPPATPSVTVMGYEFEGDPEVHAALDRLVEAGNALIRRGAHEPYCAVYSWIGSMCDCGLDAGIDGWREATGKP